MTESWTDGGDDAIAADGDENSETLRFWSSHANPPLGLPLPAVPAGSYWNSVLSGQLPTKLATLWSQWLLSCRSLGVSASAALGGGCDPVSLVVCVDHIEAHKDGRVGVDFLDPSLHMEFVEFLEHPT